MEPNNFWTDNDNTTIKFLGIIGEVPKVILLETDGIHLNHFFFRDKVFELCRKHDVCKVIAYYKPRLNKEALDQLKPILDTVERDDQIEVILLNKLDISEKIELIQEHLSVSLKADINSWEEAKQLRINLLWLPYSANNIKEIMKRITLEKDALALYPYVKPLASLSISFFFGLAEGRNLFDGFPHLKESTAKGVVLLNDERSAGVIITNSLYCEFIVVEKPERQTLPDGETPYKILFKGGDMKVTLGVSHGRWRITPHPPLKIDSVTTHYIPMHDRIVPAK